VGAFLAGLKWQHAGIFTLAGVLLLEWCLSSRQKHLLKAYQRERSLLSSPEDDAKGSGYQLLQSKNCVGSGGFWGKVLQRQSNQLGYIPSVFRFHHVGVGGRTGIQGVAACLRLYMALLFDRSMHSARKIAQEVFWSWELQQRWVSTF